MTGSLSNVLQVTSCWVSTLQRVCNWMNMCHHVSLLSVCRKTCYWIRMRRMAHKLLLLSSVVIVVVNSIHLRHAILWKIQYHSSTCSICHWYRPTRPQRTLWTVSQERRSRFLAERRLILDAGEGMTIVICTLIFVMLGWCFWCFILARYFCLPFPFSESEQRFHWTFYSGQ